MDNIIKSSPKAKKASVKEVWQTLRGSAEVGAGYASVADDAVVLAKLMGDLGAVGTRAYIKTYNGKPHIILKGHPGLRTILTGTKYGIKNPRVVTMGLGRAGAVHAARNGGIISIVLLSSFRVLDYFLTDNATLSRLVGSIATDIVKVGISYGASIAAVSVLSAFGVTLAIGPILAVVIVGGAAAVGLQLIDTRYNITNRLVDLLSQQPKNYYEAIKENANRSIYKGQELIIDYVIESAKRSVINFAQYNINRFLNPLHRY